LRETVHLKATRRRARQDGTVVGRVHVYWARVGSPEIEVVAAFAVLVKWCNAVFDEVGVCEHSQVILDDTGIRGLREMVLIANLVEVADITVEIWALSVTVHGHCIDGLDTVEISSRKVVDGECARTRDDIDIDVVVMVMKRD
jgi:hypothetical protein